MKKTKIEKLSEEKGLTIEILIAKGSSSVAIYKDDQITIKFLNNNFLQTAINDAVNDYVTRNEPEKREKKEFTFKPFGNKY